MRFDQKKKKRYTERYGGKMPSLPDYIFPNLSIATIRVCRFDITSFNQGQVLVFLYTIEMPTYNIRGIDVDFPFEAYDCQLVYMEKVIQSLQQVSFSP